MWHASTSTVSAGVHRGHLVAAASRVLAGAGDAAAGEWAEWGATPAGRPVHHLRRRLTAGERGGLPLGGAVRDVRGTPEAERRIAVAAAEVGVPAAALERLG